MTNRKAATGYGGAASNGEVRKTSREPLYDDHEIEINNERELDVIQHGPYNDPRVIYADIVPVIPTPEMEDDVNREPPPHVIYSELIAVKQLPLLPAHLQRGSRTMFTTRLSVLFTVDGR